MDPGRGHDERPLSEDLLGRIDARGAGKGEPFCAHGGELRICRAEPWEKKAFPPSSEDEVFGSLCGLALAVSDVRAPMDPLVGVSDACEAGGGACESVGLKGESL